MPNISFMSNSRGLRIYGGKYTVKLNVTNRFSGPDQELQQLRESCNLEACAALCKDTFAKLQCEEGTREAIIQQIEEWARNKDGTSPPAMWLRAGAGAGKSTLAHTVALALEKEDGLIVVSFFISRDRQDKGKTLMPTLTYQLTCRAPNISPFVIEAMKKKPEILTGSNGVSEQMEHLFVGPVNAWWEHAARIIRLARLFIVNIIALINLTLRSLSIPFLPDILKPDYISDKLVSPLLSRPPSLLFVIDGLDEYDSSEIERCILRTIRQSIPHLPHQKARFLIASRPEECIIQEFSAFRELVVELDLSAARDADKDVRLYLDKSFSRLHERHPLLPADWPEQDIIDNLVQQSSGHFIYPSTVVRHIDEDKELPQMRLRDILCAVSETSTHNALAPLDALYQHIFSSIPVHFLVSVKHFLALWYLDTRRELSVRRGWVLDTKERNRILNHDDQYIETMLRPLRSLVVLGPDKTGRGIARSFHATLFDFLLNPARSGEYCIISSLPQAHELMAGYMLKYVIDDDRFAFERLHGAFGHFLKHCARAEVSDKELWGKIRDLDYLYDSFLPLLPYPGLQWLDYLYQFLHIVSRIDVDQTGQLRDKHLGRLEGSVGTDPDNVIIHQTGEPRNDTGLIVEKIMAKQKESSLSSRPMSAQVFNSVCSLLASWHSSAGYATWAHGYRHRIFRMERHLPAIWRSGDWSQAPRSIVCGPLLHLVMWRFDHFAIVTYGPTGHSFQSFHYDNNAKGVLNLVRNHIIQCDHFLGLAEASPWSVNITALPPKDQLPLSSKFLSLS